MCRRRAPSSTGTMTKRRPEPPARAARTVAPAPGDAEFGRAALALWAVFALLTLARAALAFDHTMWGWGLGLQRFLSPPLAWVPWACAAVALAPPVARALAPLLARAGDGLARAPVAA